MTSSQFSKLISPFPLDRVPKVMHPILEAPNTLFDIHCHVFNYKDVPSKFIGMRIPMTRHFLAFLEKKLHKIIGHTDTDWFSRRAYFLHLLQTCSSWEITNKLIDYYPKQKTILTPLMLDMETGIKGNLKRPYSKQIDRMKELRNNMPDKILPFVCIDPNNPKALDIFLNSFSKENDSQFFGVKVYPSLGYLPSHPVLMDIFKICEEKNIPVTAHCGGARVHNTRKYIKGIEGLRRNEVGAWEDFKISRVFLGKSSYSKFFNEPTNWEPVLDAYPNLKLNLAHFGGIKDWKKFCKGKHENRVTRILDMMRRYDHLYVDFSYTLHVQEFNYRLKEMIEGNKLLKERVLFGSDFYMVVLEGKYRHILADFRTIMGDVIMDQISHSNPKRFLFEITNPLVPNGGNPEIFSFQASR